MKCEICGYVMEAHCEEWWCERCLNLRNATEDEMSENLQQAKMQHCILEQLEWEREQNMADE